MEGFFIPFGTILLAELFDKSQLAVLLLASQTKKHKELFLGVVLAFLFLTGAAVLAGGFLEEFIPQSLLKIASSLLFIFFGIKSLLSKEEEKEEVKKKGGIFLSGFLMILLSELGDKTQIATILFATRFNPILVFIGSLGALSLLSLAAIKLGEVIAKSRYKKWVPKVAGLLLITLGIFFFFI